jgi:hypothetical protein
MVALTSAAQQSRSQSLLQACSAWQLHDVLT